jgi:hypothetical protein
VYTKRRAPKIKLTPAVRQFPLGGISEKGAVSLGVYRCLGEVLSIEGLELLVDVRDTVFIYALFLFSLLLLAEVIEAQIVVTLGVYPGNIALIRAHYGVEL